jgi:hypothetical protein
MKNVNSLIDSIESAQKNGVPVLGAIVQYSVSEEAKVYEDDLVQNTPVTISHKHLPTAPDVTQRFKRSVRAFNATRGKRNMEIRYVGKNSLGGAAMYSVLKFEDDSVNMSSRGVEIANIWFNPERTPCTGVEGDHEAFDAVVGNMDGKIWADKLRLSIASILLKEFGAFRTRPGGGCYFVPVQHLPRFNRLRESWGKLFSEKVQFSALPVLGDDYSKGDLAEEFERRMLSDLVSLEQKLSEFFGDGRKKQPRSIAARSKEIDELLDTTTAYEALLGTKLKSVRESAKKLDEYIHEQVVSALQGDDDVDTQMAAATLIEEIESAEDSEVEVVVEVDSEDQERDFDDDVSALISEIESEQD